ncbi:hypothetical protein A3D85_03090 [Candidatus Amesbacteria bacterium RIFCSPHIGHO2_02_FULL_47_9]|uniref:Uncharacterized protein n=1 Tax=Candidatus Amesbacteria bacterium RIFCSPHIGHO2_01_FULL_48_32b TaxID=1797253 RepID=A0A1F4YGD8_9BACT|nr:MAG: hypothetical protein A2876_00715 [Candidatus Amesbacteria bacterium RIFCSPHIGHO2_01_FULL_48_32b]OGD02246.1 MAG: hypothetical protein A3D85_03090 [Candidatus Amesbacteria bacterium RIFCSPHIGHO2_02_FULL_47_9]OGD07461.1 MAG: hypothetical protein A2899_04120 [Candidatus Amesbacteria bacterium RIFCSPLOWO2_01_FULL_49_25]
MSARPRSINLVPSSEFDAGWWGGVLKWALTTGRYIVILTEMVVIAAFLSRFVLDQNISDLQDNVREKRNVLEAFSSQEKTFRNTQVRLAVAKELVDSEMPILEVLSELDKSAAADVQFSSIRISREEIAVTGTAFSENGLRTLITANRDSEFWKEVELTDVKAQGDGNISFSLILKV